MNNPLAGRIARARLIVAKRSPYFSSLLYGLIPVPIQSPLIDTAGVTPGLVLMYNPTWVASLTDEELAGLLAHELNHPLRGHFARINACENRALANKAADIPINDDLINSGYTLPACGVTSQTLGLPPRLTMEDYYALLSTQQPPKKKKGKEGENGEGAGEGQEGATGGGCGIGEHEELTQELDKQYGRTQLEVAAKQRQAAKDYQAALTKQQGRGSQDFTSAVDALLGPPKIPWSQKLRHVYTRNVTQLALGAADYSMRRPSTRTYLRNDGIIQPGLISYRPNILICVDTSGSMSDDILSTTFREVIGVIKSAGVGYIWYMEADADVTKKPQKVTIAQLMHVQVTGRGGTDFTPAIQAAEHLKPHPDILLYFTDSYGDVRATPPKGVRTIWCILTDGHYHRPPWGEVILMGPDGNLIEREAA